LQSSSPLSHKISYIHLTPSSSSSTNAQNNHDEESLISMIQSTLKNQCGIQNVISIPNKMDEFQIPSTSSSSSSILLMLNTDIHDEKISESITSLMEKVKDQVGDDWLLIYTSSKTGSPSVREKSF